MKAAYRSKSDGRGLGVLLAVALVAATPWRGFAEDTPILKEFVMSVSEAGGSPTRIVLTPDASGQASWLPGDTFPLSFGGDLRMSVEQRSCECPHPRPVEVYLSWLNSGPEDPDRRFRVDLRAMDAEGKETFQTWQTESDNRIGPREIQMGSRKGIRSLTNSVRLEIPDWAVPNLKTMSVELKATDVTALRHVPSRPSDLAPRLTGTGRDVTLHFTNPNLGRPDAWALEPGKHQVFVRVWAPRKDGQRGAETLGSGSLEIAPDGRYAFPLNVEPDRLDETTASVVFFTKQPDNDRFVRDFFGGEGQGSGYSGLWHQSSTPLIEVPWELE